MAKVVLGEVDNSGASISFSLPYVKSISRTKRILYHDIVFLVLQVRGVCIDVHGP